MDGRTDHELYARFVLAVSVVTFPNYDIGECIHSLLTLTEIIVCIHMKTELQNKPS